jgi:ribosome-binding factor A
MMKMKLNNTIKCCIARFCYILTLQQLLVAICAFTINNNNNNVIKRTTVSSLLSVRSNFKQSIITKQRQQQCCNKVSTTILYGKRGDSIYTKHGGGTSIGSGRPSEVRSKRQERVAQLVSTELGLILHSGTIKGRDVEPIDSTLRQRVSIVKTDVSPDLRQARVSISIRNNNIIQQQQQETDDDDEDDLKASTKTTTTASSAVDKRRIYSWLVRNTKSLRHTLAQRMSHMKVCPTLQFVQVDVSAAVDVMYLIDKAVASGSQRSDLPITGASEEIINEFFSDNVDDDDDDEFAWEDVNDEFFSKP